MNGAYSRAASTHEPTFNMENWTNNEKIFYRDFSVNLTKYGGSLHLLRKTSYSLVFLLILKIVFFISLVFWVVLMILLFSSEKERKKADKKWLAGFCSTFQKINCSLRRILLENIESQIVRGCYCLYLF